MDRPDGIVDFEPSTEYFPFTVVRQLGADSTGWIGRQKTIGESGHR